MRNVCIGFVLVSMMAVAANAGPTKVKLADSVGSGPGGSFTYARVSGDLLPGAQSGTSFCVELDESIAFGTEYFAEISTSATKGGAGGPDPDPLDPKTAAVFKQYLAIAAPTNLQANQYQLAIWLLEEEIVWDAGQNRWERSDNGSNVSGVYNSIMPATVNAIIASVGNPANIGNVRIMRLWDSYNAQTQTFAGYRQDQLILIPAPAAAVLGLMGLGVASWLKRRVA